MEAPKVFEVDQGTTWKRWVKQRTDAELEEINERLLQLVQAFGKPHTHGGLGVRRLGGNLFEFRISKGLRVVFLFLKPRRLMLMMTGNHDQVMAWLKENL